MKIVTTLLSAALIAGASTAAMAQSGSGASDTTMTPYDMGRGVDANPSGMMADPMAGNRGNTAQAGRGQWMGNGSMNGMTSSDVSGRWNDQSWNNGRSDRRGW